MFNHTDSLDTLNEKLTQVFQNIDWIGELPLTEHDLKILAGSLRSCTKVRDIPANVLITSMVFCARYADFEEDENINFWKKYFQNILKKDKTQMLENEYRDAFRKSRAELQAKYGFEFPAREQMNQEVVGGIYLQAILPAYLQEDFVEFFLKHYPNQQAWQSLDKLFADQIATQNETSHFTAPIRKRLIRFLQSKDTCVTAARLIKTMATAVLWYVEGLHIDDIASVLAPIEAEIWHKIHPTLPETDQLQQHRSASLRIRWGWLIEQNDILELNIKNLAMEGETPPDRLVWLKAEKQKSIQVGQLVPNYGRDYCEVNAYRTNTGYVIDTATIIDIEGEGVIVAVDKHDHALTPPIFTGASPDQHPAFFKVQPEDDFALLSSGDRLTDGDYAISLPKGLTISAAEGGMVTQHYPLPVPKMLKEQGHTVAARYTLKLPILLGDKRIDKRRNRLNPILEGQYPVRGLTSGALPIYEQGDIWLVLSPPATIPLGRLSVRLIANDQVSVHRLDKLLENKNQVTREILNEQHILRIRLNDHIPPACLLQVEVFSGLSRTHGDTRLLGLLPPSVHIIPSPTETFYTLHQKPTIRIEGVNKDQIDLASDAQVDIEANSVMITWVDPRQDAAFRLKFGNVLLPVTFDIKWSFAWVTPLNGNYLFEDALDQAVISIRGKPKSAFYLSVGDGQPREELLNARGAQDLLIKTLQLTDMLRAYQGQQVAVKLWFKDSLEAINLFTFIRPQFSEFEKQPQVIKEAISAFKVMLQYTRREPKPTPSYLIALLPRKYFESLAPQLLPSLLSIYRELKLIDHPQVLKIMPPRQRQLRLSGSLNYPINEKSPEMTITIKHSFSGGEKIKEIPLEIRDDRVYLQIKPNSLHQCLHCGELIWDKYDRSKHFHGQFKLEIVDLATHPLHAQIEALPWKLEELRGFTWSFTPFIERGLQRKLRIYERGKAHDLAGRTNTLLTKEMYEQATAAWVLKIGNHANLFASLYKSQSFIESLLKHLSNQQVAVLIYASRWIGGELENRKANDWEMLDPMVMSLAVIARAYAHGFADLLSSTQHQQFLNHLQSANTCCPELLNWALIWTEFIFLYFSDKDHA
ncbi:MAG: hypothetical protein MUF87_02455 [Anaerolineae bacterium]|jgi:hypothetical protein|nr:hypothetical protein [Anaerolineae bacterium]